MSDLNTLAAHFGILPRYHLLSGEAREITPDTQRAMLAANGVDVSSDATIHETWEALSRSDAERWFPRELIIEARQPCALEFGLGTTWRVVCVETGALIAEGQAGDRIALPGLPAGVFDLIAATPERSETVVIIAAPLRAPSIAERTGSARLWGVTAPLYGLGGDKALGSFQDLADFGAVLGAKGASFLGVNPLHAFGTMAQHVISPYSPSTRLALNTCHIALSAIPGLETSREALKIAVPAVGAKTPLEIDYVAHKAAQDAALEALYVVFGQQAGPEAWADFERFQARVAADPADFAVYEAISEAHGEDWRHWPHKLRGRDPAALAAFAASHADRIGFHQWLQWLAERQLADAQSALTGSGMALGLYLDLAVGARRSGAESWCEADTIAAGVSVGAPPDHLSPGGQNWDLAAFSPHLLKTQKYRAFRKILRAIMRHAGVLRIDHVLGLMRSFWIPDDGSPGGYIAQPFEALTAIIRIEAERAGCVVIGEDLGLVPDGFRDTMRGQNIYGYSVLQYEKDGQGGFRGPQDYDAKILACFGTHDTPTLHGYQCGRDIEWWDRLGWIDQGHADDMKHARARDVSKLAALSGAQADAPPTFAALSDAVHGALAQSPAALVSVQMDDVLGQVEAQNLPGTIDQHPNWRRAYGVTSNDLERDAHLTRISDIMQAHGRTTDAITTKET